MAEVLRVVVTGAAGQIAYSLLYSIAKGDVFGANQKLSLVLLDIAPMMTVVDGVILELQDCALPLLDKVEGSSSPNEAFKDADVAIMVGAMPRKEGMERKDLLKANVNIFKAQGEAIDKFAKKTVKVLVVGNPANTNAFICANYASSIPRENFSCLTRLDHNRAKAQIALRVGVATLDVKNVIIWGNHSSTQYPDVNHGTVKVGGAEKAIRGAVQDDSWINGDFLKTVQQRGGAIIKARKLSSAMSAAKAICDHMRDLWFGTGEEWVSMGVSSDGSYGIEKNLIYSFPVRIQAGGKWEIVQGLNIDDFSREKMDSTMKELMEERDMAAEAIAEVQ